MKRFKKLFSRMPKKVIAAVAVALAIVGVASAARAWSPERPTYTIENPAPNVTFNSITNNPDEGDERAFFEMKDATNTQMNGFSHTMNDLKGDQELLLRVYVHNNAADNLNTVPDGQGGFQGVARNTKVRVFLPTATADSLRANAYISADNAAPKEVADTINMGGSLPFGVEYVPGSATAYTNAVPSGMKLDDSIVTTGAPIGYDKLDGIVPGCFKYSSIVTLKVKVKAAKYTVAKKVRFAGQTAKDWQKSVNAKPGDKLEWSVSVRNVGSTQLKDIAVVDQVPNNLDVVPGSIVMYDANFPDGYKISDSAIQANGRQLNINIGNHNPLPTADVTANKVSSQIIFATTVGKFPADQCEKVTLTNQAFATPSGYGAVTDTAVVVVDTGNVCKPEQPKYSCDLFKITPDVDRTVKVSQFKQSASNGATFKNVVINWGDNTTPLTTNNAVGQTHKYAADGTYTINAVARFTVEGKDVSAAGVQCSDKVTFTSGQPAAPTTLPNTGAGNVAAIFAATSVAGAVAFRVFSARRFATDKV